MLNDIKTGILKPEIKLIFLLCSRLFSFEGQAVNCYKLMIVMDVVHLD